MVDYNSAYTGVQIDANLALAATATQPGDLATVATTGAYSDLTGKPTLGTAAATASTDYATAAQGTLADSATQPGDDAADLGSGAATDGYVLTADGAGGAAWEAAAGGGGTPGGTDTQVQFNDGGAFGGASGFTFDKANNTLGLGGGTITADDPIIDMAQTWNNAAVTFTAIKANVTSTASAAASLLMDLQVGGVSLASVRKDGRLTLSQTFQEIATQNTLSFILAGTSSNARFTLSGSDLFLGSGVRVSWRDNAASNSGTIDLILLRDAANTLAQRNGVNAQAFNLYNTYTDASNYERGFMSWSHTANRLVVGTGALGTGTNRSIQLGAGNGGVSLLTSSTGRVDSFANEFTINNTGGTERLRVDAVGSVRISTALTVATLPSTPLVGMMARVTDATTPVVGMIVAGGGAANAMCWYNGTNWTVIGV